MNEILSSSVTLCKPCELYVCVCLLGLHIFAGIKNWKFTFFCGDQQALWVQNLHPWEFKGIFETQNVGFVSGLQLVYG